MKYGQSVSGEAVYDSGTVIASEKLASLSGEIGHTWEKYVSITVGVTAVPTDIVLNTIGSQLRH